MNTSDFKETLLHYIAGVFLGIALAIIFYWGICVTYPIPGN